MRSALLSATTVALASASTAAGQAGFAIGVTYEPGQRAVSPDHPTARIDISAYFPLNDYAFAATRLDFTAGDGRWDWADYVFLGGIIDPGPLIMGTRVTNCINGQLNFPQVMIFANPANPLRVFEAQWSTDDFARRNVEVRTVTARFDVYPLRSSPASFSRMSILIEGAAAIRVVPAPSSLLLIAGTMAVRRRDRPAPTRACLGGCP